MQMKRQKRFKRRKEVRKGLKERRKEVNRQEKYAFGDQ